MASSGVRPIGKPLEGLAGSNRILVFQHRIVLGAGGAISSQDAAKDTNVVAVKAAGVGRYTLTLAGGRRFRQVRSHTVSIVGPTTAIYGANTTGYGNFLRNDLLSTVGTVQLQFTQGGSNADAEVPDNFTFTVTLFVKV